MEKNDEEPFDDKFNYQQCNDTSNTDNGSDSNEQPLINKKVETVDQTTETLKRTEKVPYIHITLPPEDNHPEVVTIQENDHVTTSSTNIKVVQYHLRHEDSISKINPFSEIHVPDPTWKQSGI